MKQFNIAEAKSHFSEMVKIALLGEEVVIARSNKPLLKLVPITQIDKIRKPGTAKGQILHIASDFDERSENFKVVDQTVADSDFTIISRRDSPDAVIMSLDTFNSLMETVHLLKTPANAAHLAQSIEQFRAGKLISGNLADA
jgi:antitoxin YefM